jgi:hypothetical protein
MPQILRKKYSTDNGSVFFTLLDGRAGAQEVAGDEPAGTMTENMTVRFTKNNKEVGIRPRHALLARSIGTQDEDSCLVTTAERYKRVIVLTKARLDEIELEEEFTIGEATYKVKKLIDEEID